MNVARGSGGWEDLFRLVFERSSNPIVLLDEERRIVDANEAAAAFWREARQRLLGRSMEASIELGERERARSEWKEFLRTGEYTGTRNLLRADGSSAEIEFAARSTEVGGSRLAIYVMTVPGEPASGEPGNGIALDLSEREREVVTLIALGKDTTAIAGDLHISPETVRSHVRNSMSKLGAHTRAQLVAIVICAEHALDRPRLAGHSGDGGSAGSAGGGGSTAGTGDAGAQIPHTDD